MHARRLVLSAVAASLLIAVGCDVVYMEPYQPVAVTPPPSQVTTTPPQVTPEPIPPRTVAVPVTSVPNLIGLTLQVCEAVLIQSQLKVGDIGYQRSMQPVGTVIAQEQPAGTSVSPGSRISVTLAIDSSRAVVPDVVGKSLERATQAIRAAGLNRGEVSYVHIPNAVLPTVGSQSPEAGTFVALSTVVNVTIYTTTPKVSVPDLTGLRQIDVNTRLEELELYLSEVTTENHPTVTFGIVIAQTPFPGDQVDPGTPVKITLSAGAGQVSVPNVVGLVAARGIGEMRQYGLRSRLEYERGPGMPNTIVRQHPMAGAMVAPETAVILYVRQQTVTTLLIVPAIVGQPAVEANAIIAASGLTIGEVTYAPGRPGMVLEQDPPADTRVQKGTSISYVLGSRRGQRLVYVPNVVGMSQIQAEQALRALELGVGTVTEVVGTTPGQVQSQSPVARKRVAAGTAVDLEVGRFAPAVRNVNVPDVVGMKRWAAEGALRRAGLGIGAIEEATGAQDNVVKSQSPVANARVALGTEVSLTIYRKPVVSRMVTVPNIVGMNISRAEDTLERLNLQPGRVTEMPGAQPNVVIAQSPVAGSRVRTGAVIDITVSIAQPLPESVMVPNLIGRTLGQAETEIRKAGLTVGQITEVTGPRQNRIVAQSPTAGTRAAAETPVNLTVAAQAPQQQDLVVVPNVIGMSRGQAEARIRQIGLVVGQVTERQGQPQNNVVSQSPNSGTRAQRGSPVNLVINRKQAQAQTVTVPNVTGMQRGQAEAKIRQDGLVVGRITEIEGNQQGRVQSQSPTAGSAVPAGSAVDLTVWRKQAEAQTVTVPNFVGMQQGQAQAAIARAGLTVGQVTEVAGDRNGVVLSQSPGAGTSVPPATAVSLTVAKKRAGGDQATVPAVIGMTSGQAEATIRNAGLVVGEVTSIPGNRPGKVQTQEPAAGARVAPGSLVSFAVATRAGKGTVSRSVAVPSVRGMALREAQQAITNAGLKVGRTTRSPGARNKTASGSDPAAGTSVPEGSRVDIIF